MSGSPIDMSAEAIQHRESRAIARTSGLPDIWDPDRAYSEAMAAISSVYHEDFDSHFREYGACPHCGEPMTLPSCLCGCERNAEEWVMRHYVETGGVRRCDHEVSLWRWLVRNAKGVQRSEDKVTR